MIDQETSNPININTADQEEKTHEVPKPNIPEVPVTNVSPGEEPKMKEKTEVGTDTSEVEPVKPQVVVIFSIKTRYTWDIFHIGNERLPVFELSIIESNAEKVSERFWSMLAQNVSENQLNNYKPRLKSIVEIE